MKLFLISFALFVAVTYGVTTPADSDEVELPDYAQTCDEDDPERDTCIKKSIQDMIPRLDKGINSLNIPPLDPYSTPNNKFDYKNGAVQGSITLKGVKVYGFSRSQIKDVRTKITVNEMNSEIDVYIPRIYIEGTYKADVNLSDLKLNPRGYFNITMSDINTINKISGRFEEVKGKKYLRMTKFDMDPEIGNMKVYASGIFPDPQLNNFFLDFVNQYWPEMYKQILPETHQHWEPIALDAMNQFLGRVPFEKLLTKKQKN